MSVTTLTVAAWTVLVLVGLGAAGAVILMRIMQRGKCPCGHAWTMRTVHGECTGQERIRLYVSGARRGWKYAPCKCTAHQPARLAEILGAGQ